MIKLEITEEQAKLIYASLKAYTTEIWDDPELAGVNEFLCKGEWEVDIKVFEYIDKNINPIVDQINNQLK